TAMPLAPRKPDLLKEILARFRRQTTRLGHQRIIDQLSAKLHRLASDEYSFDTTRVSRPYDCIYRVLQWVVGEIIGLEKQELSGFSDRERSDDLVHPNRFCPLKCGHVHDLA